MKPRRRIFGLFSNIGNLLDKNRSVTVNRHKCETMRSKVDQAPNSFWLLRSSVIFFKIVGLATVSLRIIRPTKKFSRSRPNFASSRMGMLYNVFLICALISSNYFSIPYRYYMDYVGKSSLTTGIEIFQGVLGTFMVCIIFVAYCIHQTSVTGMANGLVNVHHELIRLICENDLSPKYLEQSYWKLLVVFLVNGTLGIGVFVGDVLAFGTDPISWCTDILPTFCAGWFVIQYFAVVTLIQARFVELNHVIKSLSRSSEQSRNHTWHLTEQVFVGNSTIKRLLRLRSLHSLLYDITGQICEFYSTPVLFAITFIFLTLIYNVYYFVAPILIEGKVLDYTVLSSTLLWIFFLIFPLVLLTTRVTAVSKEMAKTGSVVSSVLRYAISRKAQFETRLL